MNNYFNNRKIKLSFAELFIYIIAFILLFMDGMYKWVVVKYPPYSRVDYNRSYIWATIDQNWAYIPGPPYGWIVIVLIALSIVFLLLFIFRKQGFQDKKICIFLPAINFVSYLAISIYVFRIANFHKLDGTITRSWWLDPGATFYVEAALLLFALILDYYKFFLLSTAHNESIE